MTNQLSHKDFFNTPAVKQKFQEVLNGNERQFTASLLSIVNNNKLLARASNASIMTAAMKAAVLNLPIEPSLGFAYIVPYGQDAQFQLGYKGLIQLAIRSGQFKAINSGKVYKAQFKSYDPLFETLDIDFTLEAEYIRRISEAEWLVLDDLGTEKVTEWSNGILYSILNKRTKTIITTNLSPQDIMGTYGKRVYSRVFKKTGLGTTNEHVYKFKTQQDKRMML